MQLVRDHIARRQVSFASHPLFDALDRASLEDAMQICARLAFWVMAFQDILRINTQLVRDPVLRDVARQHRAEDAGHEHWFLADMALFRCEPGFAEVFGVAHADTRDAAYALVAEALHARSDALRIVLVLALESTGHVFFEHIARLVDRHGSSERLRYFSSHHLGVEQAHGVFADTTEQQLARIELSSDERAHAFALVDRAYAAFQRMFDGLAPAMRLAA